MKTIPGAVLFDIEKASYKTKTVIRELYTPDKFEEYVQSLGVDSTSHIVVFDRSVPTCGILGSARAWWLFKVLHRRTSYSFTSHFHHLFVNNYSYTVTKKFLCSTVVYKDGSV